MLNQYTVLNMPPPDTCNGLVEATNLAKKYVMETKQPAYIYQLVEVVEYRPEGTIVEVK